MVRVTSDEETTQYAFSLVQVSSRQLRVNDIETLAYDYFIPDPSTNTTGDRPSIAPDEVWLVLQVPGEGREQVFRTWPVQEPFQTKSNEWVTRVVDEELSGLERSPWKRLNEDDRAYSEIGPDLTAAYGDARILGVGFGRGDPTMGPSKLNIYYDNLVLNGTSYSFPTSQGKGQ